METKPEKFEGFHHPDPKEPLTEIQAEMLSGLERVTFVNGHYEKFLGDVNVINRPDSAPRVLIKPSALLGFVRQTAKENQVSPWEVTQKLRTLDVEDPEKIAEIQKRYKETVVYVGDVHGEDKALTDQLERLSSNPPQYLIFEGDIIGTKKFEDLQRLFYNYLNNHSRNEILKQNPDATDSEILDYTGTKPPEEGFTLRKGFLKTRESELKLAGKSEAEIEIELTNLPDHDIAQQIRKYAKYVHYGHYASNLPEDAKKALAGGLEENARTLIETVKPLVEKGTRVIMLQGNWDARAPIDFIPGQETATPLPEEQRLFNAKTFFEQNGVAFYRTASTLETDTTLQVLLPFDALVNFPNMDDSEKEKLKREVETAREKNKSVIVVAHGEPNWQIHNMTIKDASPAGEHAQIIKGFSQALGLFLPDEIVYGHMHDPITDEDKNKVSEDTKYALQVDSSGDVTLISDPKKFNSESMLASYVPMRRLARTEVSRKDTQRKVEGFGGRRQPARIIPA